jgi:hypothetical protein
MNADLMYRERRPDGSLGEAKVFLRTPFEEAAAQFSPDARFVVYASDESGRNEVYVRDFPNGANKWQVSSNGGTAPRWRRDGREILFVENRAILSVPVSTHPAFSPGPPARLFERRYFRFEFPPAESFYPQYDVSADGKRFYVLNEPARDRPLSIHVVHNWFTEFADGQRASK